MKHRKDYKLTSDGGKQDKIRKDLFRVRDKQIKKHNSEKKGTFRKEHNLFSDMVYYFIKLMNDCSKNYKCLLYIVATGVEKISRSQCHRCSFPCVYEISY